MNLLCPEDLEFKYITSIGFTKYHHTILRNDKYGIQCEKISNVGTYGDFGKPKIYFYIDGQKREFTDLQTLCDAWNEIKNYDDPDSTISWVKVIKTKDQDRIYQE